MKYLIILILLSGCASIYMPEYEQGCYDGLEDVFKSKNETKNLIINTCTELSDRRKPRKKSNGK